MSDFKNFIDTVIKEGDTDEACRRWQPRYKDQRLYGGLTVLHWACRDKSGDRGGLVWLLVSFGCDIEAQTNYEWRPLHYCAYYGNLEAMRVLIEAGCSLSPFDKEGETPLMKADKYGYRECASLLRSSIDGVNVRPSVSSLKSRPSMTDYTEGDLLGKGAHGYVYKCYDVNMEFAIKKVLIVKNNVEDEDIKALKNEIKIYSKWDHHERIVRYFGMTSNEKEMIIFMEYLPNGTLKDKLKEIGPFPIKDVSKHSRQILEGLQFLHGQEIIHRDIKCVNILRDSNDDIKLADFGVSKSLQTTKFNKKSGFTDCGTIYWMAPEVIRCTKYTYTADVWSLGATVLEMLTGKPPFYDFETAAAMYKIENGAPVDVYFPKDLDGETRDFLDKMFVYEPSDRADVKTLLEFPFVQDIMELKTDIQDVYVGEKAKEGEGIDV